ncbi:Tim44 domain-containing protein [Paraburkholderia silvatlantica]|uniref:Lipid-binding transport protein (Tim44 family) n=1 Tax=Paraburkholderia silvatlantica TaxID=321895 RepID=A0ABR6FQ85_9BURK|nr:TIM44-like domain-containing protein [Paraburkholderia silvatlantica]MBB2929599.1 putative lipid-binding transport protein (Tim44 family) [Paraburkholderia silvatlantica]PVY35101.1 putative lipid-binding transport protein (Tim44 family) [Paraburkholderia silvatlantica]PXW39511.1 putative lipid-binding transport protein (Tim44 family) [Paraburkholderia silvatlantica]
MSEPRIDASRKLSTSWARRIGVLTLTGVMIAGSLASFDAEARRMGGGRSFGKQSSVASQRSTTPPPAQPSPTNPAQQAGAQRAPGTPAPTPAPAPARNRWLGPIAGLAAGLGIAALLSHFGLGEAFAGMMANMIVIAIIAFIAVWLIRKFMSRRRAAEPAYQGGYASNSLNPSSGGYQPQEPSYTAPPTGQYLAPEANPLTTPHVDTPSAVPAGFDTEAFVRNAKVYFVRLQAAWDAGNMDDIREFTTPEMFAEIRVDLAGRGAQPNQTDVVQLNADLLGVEDRGSEYLASVRFSGLIREAMGEPAAPFVEVWNLSKSRTSGEGWLLAGIQQVESH